MAEPIGYAALQIIPVLQGLQGSLQTQIGSQLVPAARQAGQDAGRAVADGIGSAEGSVSAASRRLAAAREAEVEAAARLRVETARLSDVQRQAGAGAGDLAEAEERVAAAQRQSDRAAASRVQAVNDLAQARARAANEADQGEESTRRWSRSLDASGESAQAATSKLTALATAAAGIGGAMALGMQAIENEQIGNKLAASLGATGDLAAEYGDRAGRLYQAGFGESMDEAASAIGMVATSFKTAGFEGEASMEKIAENALNFSTIFDQDVASTIQTTSQLVTNGLAKDSTEAFDLMTAAFQQVPAAMRDELPEILQEYGTNFRALGFDGQESFNLLVSAADQGKFALDKTGDALKEFSILGSDMSKSSVEAYEAIGLNAEEMSRKVAMGGEPAQEALQAVATNLLGITDPAERANTAIALFGTPLEDLSVDQIPAFLEGLTGAEDRMTGFAGSAQAAGDTLNSGAGAALESLKRTIVGGLTDALGQMAKFVMDNKDALVQIAAVVTPFVVALGTYAAVTKTIAIAQGAWTAVTTAGTAAQWALNAAMSANPIGLVIAGLVALGAAIAIAWNKSETFRSIVIGAWEGIKSAASAAWTGVLQPTFNAIVSAGQAVGDAAMALWNGAILPAWNGISSAISTVWNGFVSPMLGNFKIALGLLGDAALWFWNNAITPAWNGVASVISTVYNGTVSPIIEGAKIAFQAVGDVALWLWNEAITPAWNGITSAISGAWGAMQPIFDLIGKGIDGIGQIASSVAGGIKSAFAGVVDVLKAPVRYVGSLLTRIPAKVGPFTVPGAASLNEWGASLQALRSGGMVRGPGTGTSDSILGIGANGLPTALVSNGEFVTNAAATAKNLPLLQAINAGWTPSAEFVRALVQDGDFTANNLGIQEDSQLVAQALGLRSLLKDGDFTGNFRDGFGVEEDSPIIAAILGSRSLLKDGDYTGNLRDAFGLEEDSPIVDALLRGRDGVLGMDALLGKGDYTGNLFRAFGMHEDSPIVDAILRGRDVLSKLPRFAEGGLVSSDQLVDFAKGVEGEPYVWGGVNWGDCSGAVSAIANFATGRDPFASRFATGTMEDELAARGFLPGLGPAGSLNVGWFNGGPYGGHTAATLPNGVNFEMGGQRGNGQYGGIAAGADDPMFTDHAHLPPEFFTGGDLGSPTFGGSLSDGVSFGSGASLGGSSGGGAGGSSFSGGGSGGGSFTPGTGSGGSATPVFVTNWPGGSSFGSGAAAPAAVSTGAGAGAGTGAAGASSYAGPIPPTGGAAAPDDSIVGKLTALGGKVSDAVTFGGKAAELAAMAGSGQPIDPTALGGKVAELAQLGGKIAEPAAPLGGAGVGAAYGDGAAGTPEVDKWTKWAQDAAGQWEGFFRDNWREMLNTAVGVGLGGIGSGGDTYNITGPEPNAVGRVIARNQRRRSIAAQRGGLGR
ncbi:phage tail tape measure protein [Rhodococcus aetherivorans]|uniref:phage tail tape measure protein n=1 Tax=Rhodococcus aetherivorans TaxID=191292 RepID=UPI0031D242D7